MTKLTPMCRRCLGDMPAFNNPRGWCDYCEKEVVDMAAKQNGRSVHIYLPGELLEWFDSLTNKSEVVATACRQYLQNKRG